MFPSLAQDKTSDHWGEPLTKEEKALATSIDNFFRYVKEVSFKMKND